MKKLTFTLALLLVVMISNAQKDFQGMAVYESKTSTSDFKSRMSGNKDITPEMQKMIEERMKKMFEKTFILNFDKTSSIYKEEEKLDAPGQGQGGFRMMSSMMGGGGTYYKNAKEKTFTVDKEFMGKEFLLKDTLRNYKWKMEGETREIGGYTCYKATAVVPASKTDFRNFRPKKEEDLKKKEEEAKKEGDKTAETKSEDKKEKKTSFFDEIEMPKDITITAWYTMDIPVNQGPEGYWGLPGLILEVNDGKTTILCSKIVINPKEKTEIKAPSNGKVVTQKEYDDIVTKKMEEMMEMNQGQGRGGMQMRMGR
ncbi:GLPGLI family protein [Flavobacterium sp.]|uniref:GLPGLI family protein n=1 Tax=Flavobacterium sp. TaxID=239 RepID=UPI002631FB1F|nr:GLPGLI family protein [Flavobacterium sp.]